MWKFCNVVSNVLQTIRQESIAAAVTAQELLNFKVPVLMCFLKNVNCSITGKLTLIGSSEYSSSTILMADE